MTGPGTVRKRILHLYEGCGPGGAEKMIVDLVRSLDSDRYHSTVALLVEGWLTHQLRRIGIEPIHLPERGAFDPRAVMDLFRIVREHRIDLIHAHEFYTNVQGLMVARLAGIPMIATVHGKSYYTEKWRRIWAYRAVSRYADSFVAVSEDLKAFLSSAIGIPPRHITTIHNGIDLDQYADSNNAPAMRSSPDIKPTTPVIGAVGSLYPVKGHTYLLQAIREVLKHESNVAVVLVGRGELRDELEGEARLYGIQNQVQFLGYRDDVKDLIGIMDIFVLPSLSEGLPISALEAMAMGKPVIATKVGGVPEVVLDGQTGVLVPPQDPRSLAESMLFLLRNPQAARNMGRQGRERVSKKFPLQKMTHTYQELYRV